MQFELAVAKTEKHLPEIEDHLCIDMDGQIVETPCPPLRFEETRIPNIPAQRLMIHVMGSLKEQEKPRRERVLSIPVFIRRSSLLLLGIQGLPSLEKPVIRALERYLEVEVEDLSRVRENVIRLVEKSSRIEGGTVMTLKGVRELDGLVDVFSLKSEYSSLSHAEILRIILMSYPLMSANLIFTFEEKEVLFRYFFDSIWISEAEPIPNIEYILQSVESYLLAGE